jgi:hypothetical protein
VNTKPSINFTFGNLNQILTFNHRNHTTENPDTCETLFRISEETMERKQAIEAQGIYKTETAQAQTSTHLPETKVKATYLTSHTEKSLLALPNELLLAVMSHLDTNSLIVLGLANKRLYTLYSSFDAPVPSLNLDRAPRHGLAWLLREWLGQGFVLVLGVRTRYRCVKGMMLVEGLEW